MKRKGLWGAEGAAGFNRKPCALRVFYADKNGNPFSSHGEIAKTKWVFAENSEHFPNFS
jgi:hypothetical protein